MEMSLIEILKCPKCNNKPSLSVKRKKGQEIISGKLTCKHCDQTFNIEDGIPLLTYFPLENKQRKVRKMFNETPYGLVGARDSMKNKDKVSVKTIRRSPWYIRENDVKGKRMLEAGCGGGHLYTELFLLGADVIGLDQTPHSLHRIYKLFEEHKMV